MDDTGKNGYVEPYPHNDFGQSCSLPCCFPEVYGPFPWSCDGEGCFTRLKYAGLCVPCAEKQGMLREPVLGKLGEKFQ